MFKNNKGTDQPAHLRSLISTFAILLLESIISSLATSEISIFLLVSVAEETGLSLALSETPKAGFIATRPNYNSAISGVKPTYLALFIKKNGGARPGGVRAHSGHIV